MNVQALYRKYRPLTFDEVYGQEAIVTILKNQILRDEPSHAYLFAGSRGTGKTSVAKILARALNCERPQEGNPCNSCPSCRGIMEDRVLDVVEMDAASNNSVDDIRELKDKVVYPPARVKKRVYIIDEVHMLSKGAFNALLKILEEPPSHLVFILATTEPERIPATIISRTQRYHFHRISPDLMVENMAYILEAEGVAYEDQALDLIAAHSDGAMRDALSILDQVLALADGSIKTSQVVDSLGLTGGRVLKTLVDQIIEERPADLLREVQDLYGRGRNMTLLLDSLLSYYRDMMVSLSTGQTLSSHPEEEAQAILDQARTLGLARIFTSIDLISQALDQARLSQDPLLLVEVTLLKLVGAGEDQASQGPPEVKKEAPSKTQAPAQEKSQAPEPARTLKDPGQSAIIEKTQDQEAGPGPDPGIQEVWDQVTQDLGAKYRSLSPLLEGGRISSFKGDLLTYEFPPEARGRLDLVSGHREALEEALSGQLSRPIRVRFEVESSFKAPDVGQDLVDIFGSENVKFSD